MNQENATSHRQAPTHRIGILVFPHCQLLDVAGPADVFMAASELLRHEKQHDEAYSAALVGPQPGNMPTSSGLNLLVDYGFDEAPDFDTLVVSGGFSAKRAMQDGKLVAWLRHAGQKAGRLASVCNGSFILAEAGFLDQRTATTHWALCQDFAERYPQVCVEPDALFVQDGTVHTSAGVSSGMDLSLALVEQDWGRKVALSVARWLVLFLKRPGGQSQFSVQLAHQLADRDPLRDVQEWMRDHLADDLSIPMLAQRAAMSPRHFARQFKAEVGETPGRYVELLRLEAARQRLEDSEDGVQQIARQCGLGSEETLRRVFLRHLQVSPSEYRQRFRHTSRPASHSGVRKAS